MGLASSVKEEQAWRWGARGLHNGPWQSRGLNGGLLSPILGPQGSFSCLLCRISSDSPGRGETLERPRNSERNGSLDR